MRRLKVGRPLGIMIKLKKLVERKRRQRVFGVKTLLRIMKKVLKLNFMM